MMSGAARAGAVVVLGVVLAGCAPKAAEMVLDTQRVPAAEVVRRVTENASAIRSLSGSGSVSFEGPGMGGSVFFTLALKKPDSLLIRFEGPFGLDVGFLFLSRTSFVMFNRLENTVTTGDPTKAGWQWAIPFDLTVDQALDVFTGSFRFPAGAVPERYIVDGERFLLTYQNAQGSEQFWVDPATALVTQYQRASFGSLISAETSQPEEEEGLHMPRGIMLKFEREGRQLSVYYSSLTLNPEALSFRYVVPSTARIRSTKP